MGGPSWFVHGTISVPGDATARASAAHASVIATVALGLARTRRMPIVTRYRQSSASGRTVTGAASLFAQGQLDAEGGEGCGEAIAQPSLNLGRLDDQPSKGVRHQPVHHEHCKR